jgi:hypothetical protein
MGLCLIDANNLLNFRLDSVETRFIIICNENEKERFDDVFVIVFVLVRNLSNMTSITDCFLRYDIPKTLNQVKTSIFRKNICKYTKEIPTSPRAVRPGNNVDRPPSLS